MKAGPSMGREGCSEHQPEVQIQNSFILEVLEHEQQMERKKSIRVRAKRGAEGRVWGGKGNKRMLGHLNLTIILR